ncbi:UNVERIFIED_CONTAM: hypothetical protein Sindi_0741500 [Sesamum indicum]
MANSKNGGDYGSYEGDFSLPVASGPTVSSTDPTLGDATIPGPDSTPGVNTPVSAPALDQADGFAALNPFFCV